MVEETFYFCNVYWVRENSLIGKDGNFGSSSQNFSQENAAEIIPSL